jgi:hypothetical protein
MLVISLESQRLACTIHHTYSTVMKTGCTHTPPTCSQCTPINSSQTQLSNVRRLHVLTGCFTTLTHTMNAPRSCSCSALLADGNSSCNSLQHSLSSSDWSPSKSMRWNSSDGFSHCTSGCKRCQGKRNAREILWHGKLYVVLPMDA